MLLVGMESTISTGERRQTYALDRAATWIGNKCFYSSMYHPEIPGERGLCDVVLSDTLAGLFLYLSTVK